MVLEDFYRGIMEFGDVALHRDTICARLLLDGC